MCRTPSKTPLQRQVPNCPCGKTWQWGPPPICPPDCGPPPLETLYQLRAYTHGLVQQGTFLDLASYADTGGVAVQGGNIYVLRSGNLRRYTFNGSVFSLQATTTDPGLTAKGRDGTYFYVKHVDTQSITVLNNALATVTTFDTGTTPIQNIECSNGYIFVTYTGGYLKIYTFDGAAFTLVGEVAGVGSSYAA